MVKKNIFDCIIVGAGPAGLFMARELCLKAKNIKIAIMDIGKPAHIRKCSQIQNGVCTKCHVCHVVYGIGGAGMYSDGKLSSFPAGSGLVGKIGDASVVETLNTYVLNSFKQFIDSSSFQRTVINNSDLHELRHRVRNAGLDIKSYSVTHVGSENIQNYCADLEYWLKSRGINILTNTRVIDVKRKKNFFVTHTLAKNGELISYASSKLVFATGKASGFFLRKIVKKLGVQSSYNSIELGVRVECKREALDGITSTHLDAKIKMDTPTSSIRTFCMCNGGYLINCYYDQYLKNRKICTISGFSYANRKSNNSNFGILVREKFPDTIDPIELSLSTISAINRVANGGTVLQRLEDFMDGRMSTDTSLAHNKIKTTLPQAKPSNLHWLLPNYVNRTVQLFLDGLGKIDPLITHKDTLLHAPVWEMCWDKIETDSTLQTNIEGFYIIGDALGSARGIVQAAITGVIAARHIIDGDRISRPTELCEKKNPPKNYSESLVNQYLY